MRGFTVGELLDIPDAEAALRDALKELGYSDAADYARRIYVTPYPGAYGMAGVVVTVEGSPARAQLIVRTDLGTSSAHVVVLTADFHTTRLDAWKMRHQYKSGKKKALYCATMDYLKFIGAFDEQGHSIQDFAGYVSELHGHEA